MKLNRRDALKLATAGIAMPWLGTINRAYADTGAGSKRVLIFIDQYGRYGERTDSTITTAPWITDESSDYDLTSENLGWIMSPLAGHLENLAVISGVEMRSRAELGGGISHAQVNTYTLTGSRVTGAIRSGATVSGHPSIHNHIGNGLNAASSVKSVYNSLTLGSSGAYNYDDNGIRTPSIGGSGSIYSTLFGQTNAQSLQAQQIVAEHVRKQIGVIAPELVQANAATVLDAYRSSIDSISTELKLRGSLQCGDKTPENIIETGALATAQIFDATYDLFSCGLTSSIALGYPLSGKHGWLRDEEIASAEANDFLTNGNYHRLSHRNTDEAGAAQGLVMRSQISEIARLADRLKVTPELDGSGSMMMDNTVIFYHQAMCAPTHKTNLPYYHFMLAGNNTNVVRGRHFECSEHSDNELWVTLAQAVGLPTTRFGGYKNGEYVGESLNRGPISKVLNETLGA